MKQWRASIISLFLIMALAVAWGIYFWRNSGQEIEVPRIINSSPRGIPEDFNSKLSVAENVSLIAVGDIMLSRTVGAKIASHQDYKYPFLKTVELLKNADIAFGNLETAITPGRPIQPKEMIFRSDPETVEGLTYAGFDVLSLANNHSMNFGQAGIRDTFKYLDETGIDYVGAGNNEEEAHTPVIKEINGIKVAFLAYTDPDVIPESYGAADSQAGNAVMDIPKMEEEVQKAQEQADFVIVSMHSGTEYSGGPNSRQTNFAHLAIEAGAILVIGHHPHVVQTMEKYQEGYILYSLGNFVFDQMWSQETRDGLIAEIIFNPEGILEMEFYPIVIEDYSQPRFANDAEEERILARLGIDLQSQPIYYFDGISYRQGERLGIYNTPNKGEDAHSHLHLGEFDINNDGLPETAKIDNNVVKLYQNTEEIWQSDSSWLAENVVVGDINNDQEDEIAISLWKYGKYGPHQPFWIEENPQDWGNHLFIYNWRDGEIKLVWGSSTLDAPIREMVIFDGDNDGQNELIVLEGDYKESIVQMAKYVTVWKWSEWNLFNEFRGEEGRYYGLSAKDFGNAKDIYVKDFPNEESFLDEALE